MCWMGGMGGMLVTVSIMTTLLNLIDGGSPVSLYLYLQVTLIHVQGLLVDNAFEVCK